MIAMVTVTLQLEYWDSMNHQAEIEGINSLQVRGESAIAEPSVGNYVLQVR
jgi:hypothetical protein